MSDGAQRGRLALSVAGRQRRCERFGPIVVEQMADGYQDGRGLVRLKLVGRAAEPKGGREFAAGERTEGLLVQPVGMMEKIAEQL